MRPSSRRMPHGTPCPRVSASKDENARLFLGQVQQLALEKQRWQASDDISGSALGTCGRGLACRQISLRWQESSHSKLAGKKF